MAINKQVIHKIGNIHPTIEVQVSDDSVWCPICEDAVGGVIYANGDVINQTCGCDIDDYRPEDDFEEIEDELEEARERIEGLEDDLKKAIDTLNETQAKVDTVEDEYRDEIELLKATLEAEREEHQQQIATRDEIIDELEEQLAATRED